MTISHRYAIPQEERVSAQVSQVSNTKYIKVVLDKFDAQQKRMFEESNIGHVAKLPEIKLSTQLIHEMINRLIVCRKEHEAWFNINQCYCRFGLPEYSLITGLWCGAVPTDEQSKKIIDKTRLWSKYFSSSDRVTCTDLEKGFLKCPNRNDRYKLGLALIIEGIFNARDQNVGINPDTLSIAGVASQEKTKHCDLLPRKPHSSWIKIPSATTKTPYTRSGRKKAKKDDKGKS